MRDFIENIKEDNRKRTIKNYLREKRMKGEELFKDGYWGFE
jgi:hypothetical protein